MSSSSSSIVRAAIERAESRASVLNSLEKAYGTQQKASRRPAASIERNSSASSIKPVENVLNFIGDHRERTRKTLSEALLGKSIVLSNFKSQTDAAKSTRRAKSALGRLTSQRASKSKLKRLFPELCNPMAVPLLADLNTLNSLWCMYISSLMTGAQSDAQLQARLITAEMVGAKVIVVRSGTEKSPGNNKGLRGIISAVSQKCYYISYEKLIINSSPSSLATLTKSPSSSVLDFPPQSLGIMTGGTKVKPVEITTVSPKAATATAAAGKRQESSLQISCNHNNDNFNLMVADTISDCDTPEMKNVNKPVWEEVNWVKKMTVIKVIKSSSVLAVILPNHYKKPRRGKTGEVLKIVDNNEHENGKTFLLYGREHMQFSGSS